MTQKTNIEYASDEQLVEGTADQVGQDFKNAVLIVSVVANIAVITALVTLQVAAVKIV
jgi:hypothetical protein